MKVVQVEVDGVAATVDESGISWKADRLHKYAPLPATFFNTDPSARGGGQIQGDMRSDEHFIVWMRPATLPNFRKLWARLPMSLAPGANLTLSITNRRAPWSQVDHRLRPRHHVPSRSDEKLLTAGTILTATAAASTSSSAPPGGWAGAMCSSAWHIWPSAARACCCASARQARS